MLEKLFRPVAAIALGLGLSAAAFAAEPLKIGTTAAFAIPLKPRWRRPTNRAWK